MIENLEKKEFYISIVVRYYNFGKWEIHRIKSNVLFEETNNIEEIKKMAFSMIEDEFGKSKIFIKKATIELCEFRTNRLIGFFILINNN